MLNCDLGALTGKHAKYLDFLWNRLIAGARFGARDAIAGRIELHHLQRQTVVFHAEFWHLYRIVSALRPLPTPGDGLVVIALSGGVDSAVAAAMLVEQGHRVVGMTMRLYNAQGTQASSGGRCCGPRDMEDARRVAAHLGIPFYVVDLEQEFTTAVVDEFVEAYLAGETPNPCVKCNQHIKFTPLLRHARAMGADVIATGHYANIAPVDESGALGLFRGKDAAKDQSYFLFSMPPDELASVWFPLGDTTKEMVRVKAAAYGLPNAIKPESQEICFVPDGDYAGFVSKHASRRGRSLPVAGQIVRTDGTVVGTHQGVHNYTVGQHRGLGNLTTKDRLYVTGLRPQEGTVIVGTPAEASSDTLYLRDMRWLGPVPAGATQDGFDAHIQIRHRGTPYPVRVTLHGSGARAVVLGAQSEHVIGAPGQAAVLFAGDRVVGGGWLTTSKLDRDLAPGAGAGAAA
ncbi:MAG: tRNA 2-thiouridine(34) synthase MnmA [Myxococcales bacterium]|nr:tRNA 2-thiouridine(34) synthase MnmA [Myxococcales bacterium]